MIAAWMLYTVAVSVILFAAAGAAEYVARALGAGTRFVWIAAMVAAVGLSARALVVDARPPARASESATAPRTVRVAIDDASAAQTSARSISRKPASDARLDRLRVGIRSGAAAVSGSLERLDMRAFESWNRALVALWVAASCLVAAWFAGALLRLGRLARSLSPATVGDDTVLLSANVGPALLGFLRPRIVLPRWVLELSLADRDIILTHERQHAAAFDPMLVGAGLFVVAMQPWNVALWPLFARLRLALEADCDRRVLEETADVRGYGRLLIRMYERATPELAPHIAFAERRSDLAHRIDRIARRPRVLSAGAGVAALAAVVLATAAWTTAVPPRTASAAPVSRAVARPQVSSQVSSQASSAATTAPPIARQASVAPRAAVAPHGDSLRSRTSAKSTKPPTPSLMSAFAAAALQAAPSTSIEPSQCSVFARRDGTPNFTATARANSDSATAGAPRGDCAIYGDVVVVTLDSTHMLVSARDTSDAGVAVTDVMIFELSRSVAPPGLSWYSANGRATLGDSAYLFTSPGQRSLAVRFFRGARVDARDAQVIDVPNLTVLHSRFLTWDVLPKFPSAQRCVPNAGTGREAHACFLVGERRVEFPIR